MICWRILGMTQNDRKYYMTREQVWGIHPVSSLIKSLTPSWSRTTISSNQNHLQKGPHPNPVRCDFGDEAPRAWIFGRCIETIAQPRWDHVSSSLKTSQWISMAVRRQPQLFMWRRWLSQIWPLSLALDQVGSSALLSCLGHPLQPSKSFFLLIELGVTVCTLRGQIQSLEKPNKTNILKSWKGDLLNVATLGRVTKRSSAPTSTFFRSWSDSEV